jgi:tetraprenyl-beta-curcumene synthase
MHTHAPPPVTACARDTATVGASLARYWLGILPLVRRELRHWERRAQAIPDPTLRAQAVTTLRDERLNAEAAAVFATLVPRARWPTLVPLLVAFQVMYDYLDTVGEEPVTDPLRNGLQLHVALAAALDPELPSVDYYAHHPHREDGGYLEQLVARCRLALPTLPAAEAALPHARRAAARCSAGQSYTHAAMREGNALLARWAGRQDRAEGYRWWEMAAGAISSVGVYALLAAATDPNTTVEEVTRVDAAYFPSICALSALLDGFVDREPDAVAANYSSFAQYATDTEAAERLGIIAIQAAAAAQGLRNGRRHGAIVAGVVGYYLSAVDTNSEAGRVVFCALADSLGVTLTGVLATMRLRRRFRRGKAS